MAVTITIETGAGAAVDATQLLSLEVRKQLNRIPEAVLVFSDARADGSNFKLSSAASFALGAELQLSIRRDDESDTPLFIGRVVRHSLEVEDRRSNLRVELKDAALAMTATRKSVVHRGKTDKAILTALIDEAGLELGAIPATKPTHEELLQYQCTDWDFMLSRADVLGLVVRVDDGEVSLHAMGEARSGASALSLDCNYNDEFFALDLQLDGGGQNVGFQSVGWDPKNKKRLDPTPATELDTSLGGQTPEQVGAELKLSEYTLEGALPLTSDELKAWADARLRRHRLAMIRGRVTLPGQAAAPLDTLTLSGAGERFTGEALITGVVQRYDSDDWRTELELGLDPGEFARTPDISPLPAAGLLPPIGGLQLGVVMGFKEDKEAKEHRVQVALASVDAKHGPIWARVATPDAGPERGYLFWPAKGDEVVVGFLNQDPRQAVILGSTFSSVNPPPELVGPPTAENYRKAIVTSTGLTLAFDDERPAVVIETPGKNKIEIDDEAKSIVVKDQHGNSITLGEAGVAITSVDKLELTAKGDVVVKGASVDLAPS